jgi:putative salt-induced outer membrane protein YdiY
VKRLIYLFVALLSFAATAAHADVVTLKNGDRVTGTFVNEKDGKLALKSEVLGDLSISVDKIASFTAEKPVALLVKGGKPGVELRSVMTGQLELTTSGEWKLTSSGASQTIAAANVEMILLATEYEALEHHEAKPWKDWKGNSTLGFSLQRGDQDTSNLAITVAAVRERPDGPIFHSHWRTNFGLTTLLAHATQGATTVTSNTLDTSVREDYVFSPANFLFVIGALDHIGAQGLYLRETAGGGYGRTLINRGRTNFAVLAGATFVHEKFFTGVHDQTAAVLVGEKLGIQLSKRVRFDHNLNFYPNLSNTGQYRFDTTSGLTANLSKRFSLNTSLIDLYLSTPAAGSHKNNVAFTTGVGYAF